jgi:hypothetical protein
MLSLSSTLPGLYESPQRIQKGHFYSLSRLDIKVISTGDSGCGSLQSKNGPCKIIENQFSILLSPFT